MSITTMNNARQLVLKAGPDQLYLLQHPEHMDTALRQAGVNPHDLTADERAALRAHILALWADHGTIDESRG